MIYRLLSLLLCLNVISGCSEEIVIEKSQPRHEPPQVEAPDIRNLEEIGQRLEQALVDFHTPGAAIAIVHKGEVIYAEGFGLRDVESGKPMNADTLYSVASTTKAMTCTLIGMLVDEGKLQWDTPVQKYLPNFRLSDPLLAQQVTLRDLLTHRTGLPRHDYTWFNNSQTTREQLVQRLEHLPISAGLREKYQYNNLMYAAAGYIAGRVTDSTWERLMEEKLFDPLGMKRSNTSVAEMKRDRNFSYAYRLNEEKQTVRRPMRSYELIGPAGSVNSSVNEMAQWMMMNLSQGKVGEKQLIQSATLAEIHSPQMTTGFVSSRKDISTYDYCMGWSMDTYRGHRRVMHNGFINNFASTVMLFPEEQLGMVAFNNGGSQIHRNALQHAADLLLGLPQVDWLGNAKKSYDKTMAHEPVAKQRKKDTRVPNTSPSHAIEAYIGEYSNPAYGNLTVERHDTGLLLTHNGMKTLLTHWHYDVWNGGPNPDFPETVDDKYQFTGDLDGNIASVRTLFEVKTEPIVFQKVPPQWMSDPKVLKQLTGVYIEPSGGKTTVRLTGGILSMNKASGIPLTLRAMHAGRFQPIEARQFQYEFISDDDFATPPTLLKIHSHDQVIHATRQP